MKRSVWYKGCAVLAGSLAGLAFGEAGLRLYAAHEHRWTNPPRASRVEDFQFLQRPSPHPGIGYELRPGLDVLFRGRPFRTDSAGLRGRERPRRKPAGTFRIAGIGDSVMMGWGVADGEEYLSLLGKELGVETVNFAVSGYNTAQEYYTLRDKTLAYDPDLIVLGYTGNDFEPAGFDRPRLAPTRLCALNLVRRLFQPKALPSWRPWSGDAATPPAGFEDALSRISGLAAERRIPIVMILDSRKESQFMRHAAVAALARSHGIKTLNMLAILRGGRVRRGDAHDRELVIAGDGHPNEKWHRGAALELARLLRRERLVP